MLVNHFCTNEVLSEAGGEKHPTLARMTIQVTTVENREPLYMSREKRVCNWT